MRLETDMYTAFCYREPVVWVANKIPRHIISVTRSHFPPDEDINYTLSDNRINRLCREAFTGKDTPRKGIA